MQIDDNWNLVIPVTDSVRVFHSPISKAVFEANFRILSETKADIWGHGNQYALLSGRNVAALTLKDIGKRLSEQRGDLDEDGKPRDAGAQALLNELKRLSTILAPGNNGYETLPLQAAISQGALDNDDWEDVENQLVFFTCAVCLTPRKARKAAAQALADIMECSLSSSSCEEYVNGLMTSAKTGSQTASSVPT